MSKPHVLNEGLAVYKRLQSDDQDSVRLLTVPDLIAIAQQMTPPEVKELLLKQIRQSMTDKSWRVRYMGASNFNEVRRVFCVLPDVCSTHIQLAETVGQELVREELIGHYVQLLKDNEAEVRTAAAGQIPGGYYELILVRIRLKSWQVSQNCLKRRSSLLASCLASAIFVKMHLNMFALLSQPRSLVLRRCLAKKQLLNTCYRSSCIC